MATDKKAKNPRNVRTYKVVDSVYKKALARAKKDKVPLSNTIENFITEYAGVTTTSVDVVVSKKQAKKLEKIKDTGELDAAD